MTENLTAEFKPLDHEWVTVVERFHLFSRNNCSMIKFT